MNANNHDKKVVERALRAWRDEEVPERIHQAARPHLDQLRARMATEKKAPSFFAPRRLVLAAGVAAALLVAALIVWTVDLAGHPPVAFAQVVRQLETFRPYTCDVEVWMNDEMVRDYHLMRHSLAQRREEMADGTIQIVDLEAKRSLQLTMDGRAIVEKLSVELPDQDPNLLRLVQGVADANPEGLGYRQIGDVRAYGFRASRPYNNFEIWVDPATKLPVLFEVEHPEHNRRIVFSNFTFGITLDAGLFSTTPPEGYEVVQSVTPAGVAAETPVALALTEFVPFAMTQVVIPEEGTPSEPTRILHASLTQRREVRSDGTIEVYDLEAGRALTLHPDTKEAELRTFPGNRKNFDLIGFIAGASKNPTEILGNATIDGISVWGFRHESAHNIFEVWLDKASGNPVCVDITHPQRHRTIRMTDFEFDLAFDPALFSTDVPEGYTLNE